MPDTMNKDALRKMLAISPVDRGGRGSRTTFRTGLAAWDELSHGAAFQFGAVHEILSPPRTPSPQTVALLLARAAQAEEGQQGAIVWSDPGRELYPAALAGAGVDLRRLVLLRCADRADELWAIAEALRSPGVSATVGTINRLSQVEARRLQLAAERGGGVGIFLRPLTSASANYAAATRWVIRPAPGEERVQRWSVQRLHGHGGQANGVLLEIDRETRHVRASGPVRASSLLADRTTLPAAARVTA